MITAFQFRAPTTVSFGCGVRARVPESVRGRAVGLVSSPSVLAKREVTEMLEACRAEARDLVTLGTMSPNPRLSEVRAAFEAGRSARVDCVIALGGGSVLDGGKLLRVALKYARDPAEVLNEFSAVVGGRVAMDVDLVAVPTTAGTGAEVSKGAIITDDSAAGGHGVKKAARGEELIPDRAVIDPELCLSLPSRITAETGFDIVCHAIETLLSRAGTPVTDILGWAALDEVPAALRRACSDGTDLEAREVLSLHSWLMGYNLAHASTCLPHRMQYPVGTLTDTSHQAGLAALYPAWMDRVQHARPERVRRIVERLAPNGHGGMDARRAIELFLADVGLTISLRQLGVEESQARELSEAVTGRVDLDPLAPGREQIFEIFADALQR